MGTWYENILVHKWLPEGQAGDWSIRHSEHGAEPGVFTYLMQKGQPVWMCDNPKEIMAHIEFVENAKGKVLISGLGIGMLPTWLLRLPRVTQIDVVENNVDVLNLVRPHLDRRIKVIEADALTYEPTEKYDCAWHDIWVKPNEEAADTLMSRHAIPFQRCWFPERITQPDMGRVY